jgi:hypothetical protein
MVLSYEFNGRDSAAMSGGLLEKSKMPPQQNSREGERIACFGE